MSEIQPQISDGLLRITSRYFCAGAVVERDAVTRAAPIVKYMRGWSVERVRAYARGKGWTVED